MTDIALRGIKVGGRYKSMKKKSGISTIGVCLQISFISLLSIATCIYIKILKNLDKKT